MNVHFHTLGCKVNQYETEGMREEFLKRGNTCCEDKPADVIVINSCTVTSESDRKTRQLGRKLKRENPSALILLTGCMVQAFPEKAEKLDFADVVIGNTDNARVADLAEQAVIERKKIFSVNKHELNEAYNTLHIDDFDERTRAYMKIEDGCDRFCSYCIIPYARGHVRSRSIESIKLEAQSLAANGFKEVVLVGINLSAYGSDCGLNLCDAVDAVCSADGIKRVRLGSIEPDHITDEMLIRFKAQEKFCPHFHLSLQSGCDATLKRMNRRYDSEFYMDLVTRIRRIFNDAAVTTDIMVGFPGESEEEFNESLNFVKKVGFSRVHIFCYSKREGTVAAALNNQIPHSKKQERSHLMAQAADVSEQEFLKSYLGSTMPVLFESSEEGFAEGYTANYIRVKVKSDNPHTGEIINVKISEAENDYCIGAFK